MGRLSAAPVVASVGLTDEQGAVEKFQLARPKLFVVRRLGSEEEERCMCLLDALVELQNLPVDVGYVKPSGMDAVIAQKDYETRTGRVGVLFVPPLGQAQKFTVDVTAPRTVTRGVTSGFVNLVTNVNKALRFDDLKFSRAAARHVERAAEKYTNGMSLMRAEFFEDARTEFLKALVAVKVPGTFAALACAQIGALGFRIEEDRKNGREVKRSMQGGKGSAEPEGLPGGDLMSMSPEEGSVEGDGLSLDSFGDPAPSDRLRKILGDGDRMAARIAARRRLIERGLGRGFQKGVNLDEGASNAADAADAEALTAETENGISKSGRDIQRLYNAINWAEEACRLAPELPTVWRMRADQRRIEGRPWEAKQCYEIYLTLEGEIGGKCGMGAEEVISRVDGDALHEYKNVAASLGDAEDNLATLTKHLPSMVTMTINRPTGLALEGNDNKIGGVRVAYVARDSSASKSGILVGDHIAGINAEVLLGRPLSFCLQKFHEVGRHSEDGVMKVSVVRAGVADVYGPAFLASIEKRSAWAKLIGSARAMNQILSLVTGEESGLSSEFWAGDEARFSGSGGDEEDEEEDEEIYMAPARPRAMGDFDDIMGVSERSKQGGMYGLRGDADAKGELLEDDERDTVEGMYEILDEINIPALKLAKQLREAAPKEIDEVAESAKEEEKETEASTQNPESGTIMRSKKKKKDKVSAPLVIGPDDFVISASAVDLIEFGSQSAIQVPETPRDLRVWTPPASLLRDPAFLERVKVLQEEKADWPGGKQEEEEWAEWADGEETGGEWDADASEAGAAAWDEDAGETDGAEWADLEGDLGDESDEGGAVGGWVWQSTGEDGEEGEGQWVWQGEEAGEGESGEWESGVDGEEMGGEWEGWEAEGDEETAEEWESDLGDEDGEEGSAGGWVWQSSGEDGKEGEGQWVWQEEEVREGNADEEWEGDEWDFGEDDGDGGEGGEEGDWNSWDEEAGPGGGT
uniref:PDZ domain-containing protein n=1 Tax=Chromera velia CCMP2878 TaxID=1169474 RepID=A0A0G4IEE5_9ALVE|eukprot:Cvel_13720.t1-p1 / transcript=Cvel_13720.t1 / gene=Cvel_13720 / organism=Chromera_velia_CCMP2878 / gene_product=hypothetical protein / transcript_product=hypothetical protein / location=Cvel_scaffold948:39653-49328(+) / protein_length=976 / sequence_SO=supercontig / SO=protein_coding / is_pseudo=false